MNTIIEKGLQKEYRPIHAKDLILCPSLKNHFVIHEHFSKGGAGHHFDIRLERHCVLKSWASRKFLDAMNSNKKIILFQVDDHGLSYYRFEGNIESGYGRGKVEIFDSGKYEVIKWTPKTIVVKFNGTKIKGKYVFLKMGNSSWMFFKSLK